MSFSTSKSTVIEVAGEAVGIVVPDGARFRFVAVKFTVWSLDDALFNTAEDARRAAYELLSSRRSAPLVHRLNAA